MTTAASKLLREPWLLVCIVKFYCSWAFRYFTNLIKNFHRRTKLLGSQQILWWMIWSETESRTERSKWLRWVSIRWWEAEPQKFPFPILFFRQTDSSKNSKVNYFNCCLKSRDRVLSNRVASNWMELNLSTRLEKGKEDRMNEMKEALHRKLTTKVIHNHKLTKVRFKFTEKQIQLKKIWQISIGSSCRFFLKRWKMIL